MNITGSVADRIRQTIPTEADDTRRVFGYHAGVSFLAMDACNSGLDSNPIKGGSLLLFLPGTVSYRSLYDVTQKKYPQHFVKISPRQFLRRVERMFRETLDTGFRPLTSLTPLKYIVTAEGYTDEAYDYFDVVHPKITCDFGLETEYLSTNPASPGASWYQACPTCRLAELQSNACQERMFQSGLDYNILESTRQILVESCERAIGFVTTQINELEGEMNLRHAGQHGRAFRNEVDFIHLKMIHRKPPTENSGTGIEQMATAIKNAMVPATNNADELALAQAKIRILELEAEKERWLLSNAQRAEAEAEESIAESSQVPVESPLVTETDLAPLSIGDIATVDGMTVIVVGKHGGKYKIEFEDKSTRMVHRNELMEAE